MAGKGKCQYCEQTINATTIRCAKCDVAWWDGFELGKREIQSKLREMFQALCNLIGNSAEKGNS